MAKFCICPMYRTYVQEKETYLKTLFILGFPNSPHVKSVYDELGRIPYIGIPIKFKVFVQF